MGECVATMRLQLQHILCRCGVLQRFLAPRRGGDNRNPIPSPSVLRDTFFFGDSNLRDLLFSPDGAEFFATIPNCVVSVIAHKPPGYTC